MNDPTTNVWVRNFAWRTFRDAADEDYLLARYSAKLSLPYQFYWNAQQAIEKCLKCILVMNGIPAEPYGHDLDRIFRIADEDIAARLIPSTYCPPWYFPRKQLLLIDQKFEPFAEIVSRISAYGAPSQRYRTFGGVFHSSDLHKLDELYFYLRRLCMPLDIVIEGGTETYRERLGLDKAFEPHPFSLIYRNRSKVQRRDVFLTAAWRNFTFFENRALRERKICNGSSIVNSAVNMAINSDDPDHRASLEWALGVIYYPKEIRKMIRQEYER